MSTQPAITVKSRWQHKKSSAEVTVTRVTIRTVSYIAVDKSVSGSVPQWQFLEDFEPVSEPKKKAPRSA